MGLTKEFVAFFKELSQNNEKEWFHANKKRYEKQVKEPFYDLVQDVINKMQALDPQVNIQPKDAVFRINRDIRFSKDKSPYKTYVAAVVSRAGRKNTAIPGMYFHIAADELLIGGGCHQPDKDVLYAIRSAIAANPDRVKKLQKDKRFREVFGEIEGEKNKILPAEFKDAAVDLPLIFNKSFYFMANYKGQKYVLRDDLGAFIIDHYKVGKGWHDFLMEAITG